MAGPAGESADFPSSFGSALFEPPPSRSTRRANESERAIFGDGGRFESPLESPLESHRRQRTATVSYRLCDETQCVDAIRSVP